MMAFLYPVAAYFIGLHLRAVVSRIILRELSSNWLMTVIYFFSDIGVVVVGMPAVMLLNDGYVTPTINAASSGWELDICQEARLCGLYWTQSAAMDIASLCVLALTYRFLRWKGRVARRTIGAVACFAAAYLALVTVTLTINYLVYPYVNTELDAWRDVFPHAD